MWPFVVGIRKPCRVDDDNLFILRSQLSYNNVDLIKALPSICTDCQLNEMYKIWIEESNGLGSEGAFGNGTYYWVRCTNCSYSFELFYSDYHKILPILKLNIKLKDGKIAKEKHEERVIEVKEKLYKKANRRKK